MNIHIKNISFSYPEKTVLSGVNLTLTSEEPVLLLGTSGQVKTTLLRIIAGFLTPQSGKIDGINSSTRIAVLFQEDRLFDHMTVWKNWKLIREDLSREKAIALLNELGLAEEVLDQLPVALSGGMRRRIALGRALLFEADLLLLDEPYQGLDEETRHLALAVTKKYAKGRPMLVISHEASDGPALGAKVVTLEEISSHA